MFIHPHGAADLKVGALRSTACLIHSRLGRERLQLLEVCHRHRIAPATTAGRLVRVAVHKPGMDVHEREVRTRGHHAQDGRPDRVDQARVLRGTFTASASASEAPGATSSFAELGRVVAVAVLLERLEVLSRESAALRAARDRETIGRVHWRSDGERSSWSRSVLGGRI